MIRAKFQHLIIISFVPIVQVNVRDPVAGIKNEETQRKNDTADKVYFIGDAVPVSRSKQAHALAVATHHFRVPFQVTCICRHQWLGRSPITNMHNGVFKQSTKHEKDAGNEPYVDGFDIINGRVGDRSLHWLELRWWVRLSHRETAELQQWMESVSTAVSIVKRLNRNDFRISVEFLSSISYRNEMESNLDHTYPTSSHVPVLIFSIQRIVLIYIVWNWWTLFTLFAHSADSHVLSKIAGNTTTDKLPAEILHFLWVCVDFHPKNMLFNKIRYPYWKEYLISFGYSLGLTWNSFVVN